MKEKRNHLQKKGKWGESLAAGFLIDQGITILDRNIRTQYGEIDILGLEDDMLVFFEVKTRFSKGLGFPEVSVNQSKAQHMIQSAAKYLQDHPEINCNWRIDVIAVTRYDSQPHEIRWFRNAVSS